MRLDQKSWRNKSRIEEHEQKQLSQVDERRQDSDDQTPLNDESEAPERNGNEATRSNSLVEEPVGNENEGNADVIGMHTNVSEKSKNGDIETGIITSTDSSLSSKRYHRGKALEWSNISMFVKHRRKETKTILDRSWGQAKPGETTAILGASGAGKTSLFHILAGRMQTHPSGNIQVEGEVRLGGVPIRPCHTRSLFAYVAQRDALHEASTPREALLFSAKLRLSATDNNETEAMVDNLIESLGLSSCSESIISSLSGGERRRTSIGVELVSDPSIIFLDEPTSGLDSSSARQVLKLLKEVARADNTVLFTIHQPSSKIFQSFDRLLLLHKGRTMYQGLTSELPQDFETLGYPVPANYNPADWMLDIAQGESEEELETHGFFSEDKQENCGVEMNSAEAKEELALLVKKSHKHSANLFTELKMLMARERHSLIRNPTPMIMNVCVTSFLAIVFGVIFFGVGKGNRANFLVVQGIVGALVNILIAIMMGQSQNALMIFGMDRPLFLREYSTNHYTVAPYFLSKLAAEALQSFVAMMVQDIIVYYMIGFQMNFFIFFVITFALALTTTAVCVLIGSMFSEPQAAMAVYPLIIVPQFYFSGVFIATELIPSWISWAQYLCSLKYGAGLAFMYEFEDCGGGLADKNCDQILQQNSVNEGDRWWYWLALCGLFMLFRCMAMLVLRKKGKDFAL